jgi:hypothetical protein
MDDKDFLRVVGKVPRIDNDGNPVTNAILGSGGTRRDDGTLSSMVRDLKLDDGEQSASSSLVVDVLTAVLATVVGAGAAAAAPHVKRWLVESVAPAAAGKVRQIARRPRTELSNGIHTSPVELAEPATEVAIGLDEPQPSMTSAEWSTAFDVWQALAACEELLRTTLANAQIVDGDDASPGELQGALAELTPEQRADLVRRMLEEDPSLPDLALARLRHFLGEAAPQPRQLPKRNDNPEM